MAMRLCAEVRCRAFLAYPCVGIIAGIVARKVWVRNKSALRRLAKWDSHKRDRERQTSHKFVQTSRRTRVVPTRLTKRVETLALALSVRWQREDDGPRRIPIASSRRDTPNLLFCRISWRSLLRKPSVGRIARALDRLANGGSASYEQLSVIHTTGI